MTVGLDAEKEDRLVNAGLHKIDTTTFRTPYVEDKDKQRKNSKNRSPIIDESLQVSEQIDLNCYDEVKLDLNSH